MCCVAFSKNVFAICHDFAVHSSADFGHAGSSYHSPRTCNRGGGKHWIGTLNFGRGFGLEESVREIRVECTLSKTF
jgi:hypothetical protein